MNFYTRVKMTLVTIVTFATIFPGTSINAQVQAVETPSVPQLVATSDPPIATIAAPAEPSSSAELPDAPSAALLRDFAAETDQAATGGKVAPKYSKNIASEETAQPITGHDKAIIGLRDLYSPFNFMSILASAGYSHALNGAPNYGTDSGAFGQRLGAAGISITTQGFFTDVVFSPMLHMDPRYYVMGRRHGFIHRAFYAGTRVLVSKNDSGRNTINGPLLLGYAASTALSETYYPKINRNFGDAASEYGESLGGAAVGFLVSEFSETILKAIHVRKE